MFQEWVADRTTFTRHALYFHFEGLRFQLPQSPCSIVMSF